MWDNLSMKDRANYIKLAVDSGITDIKTIRKVYNTFSKGGFTDNKEEPIVYSSPEVLEQTYKDYINNLDNWFDSSQANKSLDGNKFGGGTSRRFI